MRRRGHRIPLVAGVVVAALALGAWLDVWLARAGAGVPIGTPATAQIRSRLDAAFAHGVRSLRDGRHAEALERFHDVLRMAPSLPEAHVNAGFALLGLGRPAHARAAFTGALELRATQANAYWGLAVALEALGDVEGARGAMRAFVHLAPPELPHVARARAALWEWEARRAAPAREAGS